MSEIPLNYQTAYEWTGEDGKGEVKIGELLTLPVGSPHDSDRFCPEHVLVIAVESCLANYVLLLSKISKLEVKAYQSTADGEIVKEGKAGYRFKRIVVRPVMTVEAGKESNAEKIIHKSHDLCMISRSLNCPVDIEPTILTE
jgi:organic hydroperoxide reductase OsmC/OhrA